MSKFNHSKLSAEIARSGLTQIKIGERMGVHYNTISAWANNKSPHPDKLYNLLSVLGWDSEAIANEPMGEWYLINGATPVASQTEE
jgi:transcriptional regulator with XRE-family HTH domain